MSNVRWIKIVVNVFDDEKIQLIETLPDADMLIVIWFKLLAMAGKCNDCGMVYLTRDIPYNVEMLSTIMRRPANTIRLALSEFAKLGMISIDNDFIAILNWEKHQTLGKLEMSKENTRKRVSEYRKRQKLISCKNVTDVTKSNADRLEEDKNRLEEDNIYMFENWWNLYDKKRGKEKSLFEWCKINPDNDTYSAILVHTEKYTAATPKQYRKDPERYLKYHCWNDEVVVPKDEKSFRDRNAAIDNLPPEQQDAYRKQMEQELKQILNNPRKITNDTE